MHTLSDASLIAPSVKYLSAMQETRVQLMGLEETPEKEMATHSSILAWRIPLTEEPDRLQSMGSPRVGHDLATEPPPVGHIRLRVRTCTSYPEKGRLEGD